MLLHRLDFAVLIRIAHPQVDHLAGTAGCLLCFQSQLCLNSRRAQSISSDHGTVLIIRNCHDFSVIVDGPEIGTCFFDFLLSDTLSVHEKLHTGGARINLHIRTHALAARIAPAAERTGQLPAGKPRLLGLIDRSDCKKRPFFQFKCHLRIIHLRRHFTCDIDAAGAAADLIFRCIRLVIRIFGTAVTAFADIIPGCPDIITHDLRGRLRDFPEIIGISDQRL